MALDLWAGNILKIIFVIIGVHLTLTKIIPLIQDFLTPFIEKKAGDAFTSLLGVLVIVLGGLAIISFITAIGNPVMEYIAVLEPGFKIMLDFLDYFKYAAVVVLGFAVLKSYKLKK